MASNEYVWQEYSALKRRVFNQFGKCICLLAVCKQATQLDSLGLSIESSDICWLSQTSVQIFLEFPVLFSFSKNMSTSLIILVYTLRTLYVWKYPVCRKISPSCIRASSCGTCWDTVSCPIQTSNQLIVIKVYNWILIGYKTIIFMFRNWLKLARGHRSYWNTWF